MDRINNKQRIQVAVGIIISVICLAAIFFLIDIGKVIESLKSADYRFLLLSGPLIVAYLALRAVRWRVLLDNAVPLLQVFHIQNIGYMLTQLLPLRLGDVARAILIGSVPPISIAQGLSTMVVERVLDLLFIVTLLPLTVSQLDVLPAELRTASLVTGLLALTATIVLIVAANFRPKFTALARRILIYIPFLDTDRWTNVADELLLGLDAFTHLRSGLSLLFWSIALWVPMIFAYYTVMLAAGLDVNLVTAAYAMCAAALSIAVPSSPGQIGVFHAGVIAALLLLGLPETESTSFAFLYHAFNLVIVIVLGVIGLLSTTSTIGEIVGKTLSFMQRSSRQPTP